ncbi:hypothetical protein Tco_1220787 [Tanacetum coccineum]
MVETSSHNTSSPEFTPKEEPVTLDKPESPNPFLPATQVEFTFEEIAFTTNNEVVLLYPSYPNQEYFKDVSDFISKCCLKEAFTRAPTQYKEYLSEFWYTTKTLEDSKVWVSTPTSEVRGDIGYNGEIGAKGTLKKSCLPPKWRLLMGQIIQCLGGKIGGLDQISNKDATILYCMANGVQTLKPNQPEEPPFTTHIKDICKLDVPVVSKAPKPSSQTKEVPQGKKPRAKSGLRRKQSSKHTSESQTEASKNKTGQSETETKSSLAKDKSPSHPSPPTPVDIDEGTKNYSFNHIFAGSNPSVLVDKTKFAKDGLKMAHIDSGTNKESRADDISKKIKLEDLSEFFKDTRSAFFTPNSPQDEPIIVTNKSTNEESRADDISKKIKLEDLSEFFKDTRSAFFTPNSHKMNPSLLQIRVKKRMLTTKKLMILLMICLTSVLPPPSPKSAQIQELMAQARLLYPDVNQLTTLLVTSLKPELSKLLASHDFASCLPTELKELPSKFTELSREIKELKFATVVENASAATTKDVPSTSQATASPAEGEKNTNDAETNLKDELVDLLGTNVVTQYYNKKLLFDKYCDKTLQRKKSPNLKVRDLHLAEWREVIQVCPDKSEKRWKTDNAQIKLTFHIVIPPSTLNEEFHHHYLTQKTSKPLPNPEGVLKNIKQGVTDHFLVGTKLVVDWRLEAELQALPVLVSSVQIQLKTLDSLPSLLNKVTETLNRFATMVENASEATTKDVPSAGQATASPAKGENNTKDAETNLKDELVDLLGTNVVTRYYNKKLIFDKYCDKMLKRKKSPKITNCEFLTKKGPISLKIYREDGYEEVISNLKVSDLHLAEWREVIKACPDKSEKGWKTIYDLVKTRLDQLTQTEQELKIDLNKPFKEQDPLNELNELANKKRKRTNDLNDHSRSLEDWEVSSLQCMQYHTIGRCNNYAVLQSIPCSPKCKFVRQILLDHPLNYALTATADVPTDFVNNVNQKKEAIQYPRFIKLIIAYLMKKFPDIPQRIEEDYHSIKDDIPLVSVYTTRNVLVRGMLIPDAFLTEEIYATDDFKGKKRKQSVGESSSLRKSHKITIRKEKQRTPSNPPPSDDRERDEIAEATLLSITLHKTALAAEAQENIAKVQEKLAEEEIEKMVEGEEDEESYASEFADSILNDDFDDSGTKIEPGSHKENPKNVDDDEIEKEKKDEGIEKEEKDDTIEKTNKVDEEKDIVTDVMGSMEIRKE